MTAPTAQEIFDTVAVHLLQQEGRSEDGEGCLYRSPDGKMCAVGRLIATSEYRAEMERSHLNNIFEMSSTFRARYFQHRRLLKDLQEVHDGSSPNKWPSNLRYVAERYGLTYRGYEA